MQWLNEPASWQRADELLKVSVDPGTDFWRETGYGYIHDNGHVYGESVRGDLDVSVRVRAAFTSHYDQAGIMLRIDEQAWVKAGLEFFEGRTRLSTVLTLGRSSWMVTDLPQEVDEVTLRASRRGDAVEVRYSADGGTSELAALVYLPPDAEVLTGIMCAAPEGPGFSVTFRDLRIAGRSWNAQAPAESGWDAGQSAGDGLGGWPQDAGGGWAPDAAVAPEWGGEPDGPSAGAAASPGPGAGASPAPDLAAGPAADSSADTSPQRAAGAAGTEAPAAAPPAKPAKAAKNGRMRGKAKQAQAPVTPPPEDAADEWISLLTADTADD